MIGHYQLLESIGRGGMGLVYRARDTRLERDVAVKCLRTELFINSHAEFEGHYIERFKREALLLAKLNHPNIVQIYDFIEAPEQLALVMELVDGQNLQTYLREHLAPMSQRLQWLAQIAEGLAIAHDAGIIHRDLKAENILINKRGQAKITDLGIAKSQDFNATLTDHVAGSYCSMSPEQAMGESIGFKSDLFSLGILAYQLLCGAHPFGDTSNKLQIMQRIISHAPTPPQQHNPTLPAEFVDLLGQLLSKDPNKRPDNTHWVAAQFKKLSAMNLQDNSASDDTQALAMPHSNTNNNHITRSAGTQDHPTFETRFVAMPIATKISAWQKLKSHIAANAITFGSLAISLLIVTGVAVWQLQPKPPKYVAVIPPKLTAEGMQESQQELVKGAVYDAIQQSLIQLNGYHLIPEDEITATNGNNETVLKATGADELITTEVRCKVEFCSATISRLRTDKHSNKDRLIVADTKTIDVLTENLLVLAGTIQSTLGNIYKSELYNSFVDISESEYTQLLTINTRYIQSGASIDLLDQLDQLNRNTKLMSMAQTLYTEIGLDLHHETRLNSILERIQNNLVEGNTRQEKIAYFYNTFYLSIEKEDFTAAENALLQLKKLAINQSSINELYGYSMIARNEYALAIEYYTKAVSAKKSASNITALSNAYRYAGDLQLAKQFINESLAISPENHKTHSLKGLIALLEGDINAAINSFEVIAKKNPTDIYNMGNLGLCYTLNGNYEKAIDVFSSLEKADPGNLSHTLNKADAYDLAKEHLKAQETYNIITNKINASTKNSHDFIMLAQAYAHLGEFDAALRSLKDLETTDPENIQTPYTAALVHTLAGNKSAATFNISLSLKTGMHAVWFKFPWFDGLCTTENFNTLMSDAGARDRCSNINLSR
ncbi:protein kinase domain-containing protein [Cellvibrio fontiphilus]|uniref:Protein kinase n=1 Tax=Cellvibrio fontiphilus TaxID=1815559 RepID=A0ABV7FCF4_9GAMM